MTLLPLLLLALPAAAAAADADVAALFDRAVRPPTTAYQGRMLVVTRFGARSRASETRVYYRPPNQWRHELLGADGKPERVTLQKGAVEWIWQRGETVALKRDIRDLRSGELDRADLRALVGENFQIKRIGRRDIAGRPAHGLQLNPAKGVGPRRLVWVDPETGIVLHRRQTNHHGRLTQDMVMVSLTLGEPKDKSLFEPNFAGAKIIAEAPRPALAGAAALESAGFANGPWRQALGFGFKLDSVRALPHGDVLHYRYTNGLAQASYFVSKRRVDADRVPLTMDDRGGAVGRTWAGNVLQWRRGGYYHILVADLSPKTLRQMRRLLALAD